MNNFGNPLMETENSAKFFISLFFKKLWKFMKHLIAKIIKRKRGVKQEIEFYE